MKRKNVGKRIFDKNMEVRKTIRLDEKHIKVINKVIDDKKADSVSEAIRYIIENFKAK